MEALKQNGSQLPPSVALEPYRAQGPLAAYEPRDFDQAMTIATIYAKSGMIAGLDTPEKAFLVLATGAELNIPATAALRSIYIIKDKPCPSSDLLVALCMRHPDCEYFEMIESTEESATYETKRVGQKLPKKNTFTMDDARRAQLAVDDPDSNWSKYRRAMLRHRAKSELAKMVYPDLTLGLVAAEEMDGQARDVTPSRAPMALDAELVVAKPEVVDATTATTAAPAAIMSEPTESLADAMTRWRTACDKAVTTAEIEKVKREAAKRLEQGMPERAEVSAFAKAAIERVRTAYERKPAPAAAAPAPTTPVQAELPTAAAKPAVAERQPGEDDE